MAHQWFGDLVTMRWWDDLWLNEGFASWMESRTTDAACIRNGTSGWSAVAGERRMRLDAPRPRIRSCSTSRPSEQASQAFDTITYSKGEAVIRMLEAYVGADAWRDGVRRYIEAPRYGNTVSDDLWRAIEAAAGKPVTAIAHDFTLQPGVPLIRVVRSRVRSGGTTTLTLAQGEFSKDRPNKSRWRWRVPVIAQGVNGATARAGRRRRPRYDHVPGCGAVVVNAGQSGYYRTLYTQAQLAASGRLSRASRHRPARPDDDAWALGLAGLRRLRLARPRRRVPPTPGRRSGAASPRASLASTDSTRRCAAQPAFRAFAIGRLAPVLARIGWSARRRGQRAGAASRGADRRSARSATQP